MQSPTQLPVETKRAAYQIKEAKSPSSQSSTSAGDSHSEQYLAEEAFTPSILYPSTPTPTALYESAPSFNLMMWPAPLVPERQRLKSSAKAFIPMSCHHAPEPANSDEELSAPIVLELHVDRSHAETPEPEPQASPIAAFVSQACEAKLDEALPSQGSKLHSCGECKPCAWFWKASGCASGKECDYCHLCSAGELKKRKKAKVHAFRAGLPAIDSHGSWRPNRPN